MGKKINLTLICALSLGGCSNAIDAEYIKILNGKPNWVETNKFGSIKEFNDISIEAENKKSPFIRIKTVSENQKSETVDIYRLDCDNQRYAKYYSKLSYTRTPNIQKKKEDNGEFEYNVDSNSEDFYYNPTQPNSIDTLWRTIPEPYENNFLAKHCKLDKPKVVPKNTKMQDWTYMPKLSERSQISYVKTDQLNALRSKGQGELSIKSFENHPYTSNTSHEMKVEVDCKNETIKELESIRRDNDYEFAPALDQTLFNFKKTYTPNSKEIYKNPRITGVICK